ncbi:MAG: glycosyltransferase family 39 protein [Rhizobiaceae bacterium]
MTKVDYLFRRDARRPILLVVLWTGFLLAITPPNQSFMAHDEGYYAQQARIMLQTGDWITQHWLGNLTYDRAMGIVWLVAASQSVFGFSEIASRLPGMLASLGAVLLTYAIGTRFASRSIALTGSAILAVTPVWMQASKLATQDIPLAFVGLLAVWALLRAEDGKSQLGWGFLAGAAFSIGFALKSFMIVPIIAALAPYVIWEHNRHRHLSNPGIYLGAVIGFIPSLLWLVLSYQSYGWRSVTAQVSKLFFLAGEDFHDAGPLYYFWNIPATAFPWPLFAIAGAAIAWRAPAFRRKTLFIGLPVVLFLELTAFSTRTWYYGLQLLPYLSLLAAVALMALARSYEKGPPRAGVSVALVSAVLGLLLLGAASVVIWLPDLLGPDSGRLAIAGAAAGLCLFLPLAIVLVDWRLDVRSSRLFLWAFFAGPAIAIAMLFATGLWGDYGARIKEPLTTQPLRDVLHLNRVDILIPATRPPSFGEEMVLLALYSPRIDKRVRNVDRIPQGGYAWVHLLDLPVLERRYLRYGKAGDWHLLRFDASD